MGMCASGDIFHAKVDDLIGDEKSIKMYIHDVIILIKYRFEKHIKQIRIIFRKLNAASVKFNVPKCSFS